MARRMADLTITSLHWASGESTAFATHTMEFCYEARVRCIQLSKVAIPGSGMAYEIDSA